MSEPKRKERICIMDGLEVWGIVTGELVRCRDCKYGKAVKQVGCIRLVDKMTRRGPQDDDGFCAWGERE